MFCFSKKRLRSLALHIVKRFLIANQLFCSGRYANKDDKSGEPELKGV